MWHLKQLLLLLLSSHQHSAAFRASHGTEVFPLALKSGGRKKEEEQKRDSAMLYKEFAKHFSEEIVVENLYLKITGFLKLIIQRLKDNPIEMRLISISKLLGILHQLSDVSMTLLYQLTLCYQCYCHHIMITVSFL